jgi:predicted Zn finger-like uncharacterized protein
MISRCSKCQTSYEVDESKIQGGRVLLRCQVCGHWFSDSVKPEPEATIAEPEPQTDEPVILSLTITQELPNELSVFENVEPEISTSEESIVISPTISQELTNEQLASEDIEFEISIIEEPIEETRPAYLKLLVADTPTQFRTRVVKTLNEIDPTLELVVVDDGGLAMGALAGFAPDLAIIGTAIEKVYCFEICDYMRGNDRLKDAKIIFAAELHQAAWNCAEPESLYGADAWMSSAVTDDELLTGLRDHIETVRTSQQQSAI